MFKALHDNKDKQLLNICSLASICSQPKHIWFILLTYWSFRVSIQIPTVLNHSPYCFKYVMVNAWCHCYHKACAYKRSDTVWTCSMVDDCLYSKKSANESRVLLSLWLYFSETCVITHIKEHSKNISKRTEGHVEHWWYTGIWEQNLLSVVFL